MRRTPTFVAALVGVLALAFGAHAAGADQNSHSSAQQHSPSLTHAVLAPVTGLLRALAGTAPACADVPAPRAHCLTRYLLDDSPGSLHDGWTAADIASAYDLPIRRNPHQTIGISIAYDDPNLEQDLAVYRRANGLPPCTTANGCFRKVNQAGHASPLPAGHSGWALETSLDVQMVSAACPKCHILVVEANSDGITNLADSVDTAVTQGADIVSASYGVGEYGGITAVEKHFRHPGHPVVASAGDNGYATGLFPAVDKDVTAVGGTTLSRAPNPRGWREFAWGGGTSACSLFVDKPAWQHDGKCDHRTVVDISAVAKNLSIYDTYGQNGWMQIDGTSAAAPIVASDIALSGSATSFTPQRLYGRPGAFYDVRGGANDAGGTGSACRYDYLCMAVPGYDGPTGWGSPRGTAPFVR